MNNSVPAIPAAPKKVASAPTMPVNVETGQVNMCGKCCTSFELVYFYWPAVCLCLFFLVFVSGKEFSAAASYSSEPHPMYSGRVAMCAWSETPVFCLSCFAVL